MIKLFPLPRNAVNTGLGTKSYNGLLKRFQPSCDTDNFCKGPNKEGARGLPSVPQRRHY